MYLARSVKKAASCSRSASADGSERHNAFDAARRMREAALAKAEAEIGVEGYSAMAYAIAEGA